MMKKQKSTLTGNTEQFNDATIAEYSDGSWRYTGDNGRTKGSLARKPAWLTSFNKETALAANDVKKDKRKEAFMRGIVAGAKGVSPRPINNSDEAFEYLVEVRTEVALSGDSGSLGDAKWIDEALHGNQKKDTPKIEIHIDNATLNAIQQVEERHVIEGEYVEHNPTD